MLSPVLFQKQLGLIESRRIMRSDVVMIANAAHAVVYETFLSARENMLAGFACR